MARSLYDAIVSAARHPAFFTQARVPDTPEGRYEMLALHLTLVLGQLSAQGGPAHGLAQALTEVFVQDMDDSIREMGIGDTGVARRVKKAAAGLYDRHNDYGRALAAGDRQALAAALERHVFGGSPPDGGAVAMLADAAILRMQALAGPDGGRLLDGVVTFSALGPAAEGARPSEGGGAC